MSGQASATPPTADAVIARRAGNVCVMQVADCMPVLFAARDGRAVAVAHAGWRGLAAGVLEATGARLAVAPAGLVAWLGPAVGPRHLAVGALGGVASAAFQVAFLWVPEERGARILPHFVSFATGALLGAALLGLLPEAMKGAGPSRAHDIGLVMVVGLGVFFVIEKLVLWGHAHSQDEDGPPSHAQ